MDSIHVIKLLITNARVLNIEVNVSLNKQISRLKEGNRTVTDSQWVIVQDAISKCNLPLFVKLVYDEIAKWRSYRFAIK